MKEFKSPISISLPISTITHLDYIVEKHKTSRNAYINYLLKVIPLDKIDPLVNNKPMIVMLNSEQYDSLSNISEKYNIILGELFDKIIVDYINKECGYRE